jgi:hypothetical protein
MLGLKFHLKFKNAYKYDCFIRKKNSYLGVLINSKRYMNILYFEFQSHNPGSYNGQLGALIGLIREYRNLPQDEAKQRIPKIQSLASALNNIDETMGNDSRNYIDEIMQALDKESDKEVELLEELAIVCATTLTFITGEDFALDDCMYEYFNVRGVQWLEFYSHKQKTVVAKEALVLTETFRSICYRHGVIFINHS